MQTLWYFEAVYDVRHKCNLHLGNFPSDLYDGKCDADGQCQSHRNAISPGEPVYMCTNPRCNFHIHPGCLVEKPSSERQRKKPKWMRDYGSWASVVAFNPWSKVCLMCIFLESTLIISNWMPVVNLRVFTCKDLPRNERGLNDELQRSTRNLNEDFAAILKLNLIVAGRSWQIIFAWITNHESLEFKWTCNFCMSIHVHIRSWK